MFLLPVEEKGSNPLKRRPVAVYVLVALNAAVYAAMLLSGQYQVIVQDLGFRPATHEWSTLLTHMFVHAGLLHILGNMIFLWMFGDNVEDRLGSWTFTAVYLGCGLAAVGAHWATDPGSNIATIGASGAVSGVMGLYAVLFYKVRLRLWVFVGWVRVGTIPVTALGGVVAWLGEQAVLGLISGTTHVLQSTAYWAHAGGLVAGLLAGLVFRAYVLPKKKKRS